MENKRRTTLFENGLIWLGAAISIAEILTGTYFAPLGIKKGFAAILAGHLIGFFLLFAVGSISGKLRKPAMETVKISFGERGGMLFSILNTVQLIGWTGIMIYDGALAAEGIWSLGQGGWCLIIGSLILLWLIIGVQNPGKLNTAAMTALFVLTLILSHTVFSSSGRSFFSGEALSFGAALELAVAMPLSWLPLIGDYTSQAEFPNNASAVSAGIYSLASCWMYSIGMGAAIFTGKTNLAQIMTEAGMGIAALLIIVLSTVTTTFLDAYSAGLSLKAVFPKISSIRAAAASVIIGSIGAILFPMDNITDFLYLIGSVFTPMAAVLIADLFTARCESCVQSVKRKNLLIWLLGLIIYRILMRMDLILGSTVPDIFITLLLWLAADKLKRRAKDRT